MANPNVDWFFNKPNKWQEAYLELRKIVLECELTEELKWGCPCYTHNKTNVVLIHGFKDYCALLFMQGALLKDPKKILVQQTASVQAARQIRFHNLSDILTNQSTIKAYVQEAVKNTKAGLKAKMKTTAEFEVSEEFQEALNEIPELKSAFYALTPGRQRGYLLYFSSAKQHKTRKERVEKYIPKILAHKGIDD